MYNRGDLAASISYTDLQANSSYFGTTTNDFRPSLAIPFFGITFHRKYDSDPLISSSFAITYSKTADLNRNFSYQGVNNKNSIIDYFINDAYDSDGLPFEPEDLFTPTNLAFESFLIDTLTTNGVLDYGSVLNFQSASQYEQVKSTGSLSQWNFSYAVNLRDRLFLGAGIGIRNLDFTSKKTYRESDFAYTTPGYDPIDQFTLSENLKVSGTGYNVMLGAIARPVEGLQIGLSYESPTAMLITDIYSAEMNANWNNFNYYGDGDLLKDINVRLDQGLVTDYKLRTPSRLLAGATYIFGKKGLVTFETESIDYGGSRYTSRTQGVSFSSDNAEISSLYKKVMIFRAGGEVRAKVLRFRGGLAFRPDPYNEIQNGVASGITTFTAGFGYRKESFYVDASITQNTFGQSYRPYRVATADSPLVKSDYRGLLFQVTVGLPFTY